MFQRPAIKPMTVEIMIEDRRRLDRAGLLREHIQTVVKHLIWKFDAFTIRVILGACSFLWSFGAFTNPKTFVRTPYAVLDHLAMGYIAPWGWASLFLLHFAGVAWRIIDPVERDRWALVVNVYGFVLWLSVTMAVTYSIGALSAGTGAEWILCLFAAWTVFKSGAKGEPVSS